MVVEISIEGVFVVMFFLLLSFILQAFAINRMIKNHVKQMCVIEVSDSVVSKKRGKK